MTSPPLDVRRIVEVLDHHQVAYVLIGGYAANVHGAQRATEDIDITPSTERENLARLALALADLSARIRVDNIAEGLSFDTSADALLGMRTLNLRTPHGDLDLSFEPDGTRGYEDLAAHATARTVAGITVHVASLNDIIRSKEAAGRRKDEAALPELYALAAGHDDDPIPGESAHLIDRQAHSQPRSPRPAPMPGTGPQPRPPGPRP
ncbi:MAG TPA: nucleotidyl transferase AbiEii/AbiGii toxin family protein [Mycobacteriales bacterium]|jgi:hypothetical protein|nr:nucleotidyl transferase AbiEii/AbiGii toxin family protein [Mycobacteriales bacterium]